MESKQIYKNYVIVCSGIFYHAGTKNRCDKVKQGRQRAMKLISSKVNEHSSVWYVAACIEFYALNREYSEEEIVCAEVKF